MTEEELRVQKNRELVANYPFLAHKAYDLETDHCYIPDDYDYSWTWYDDIPTGWAQAFGSSLLEELKQALEECNYVDDYVIMDIKEKYGTLRWYDAGIPDGCRAWDVLSKYEDLSARTCIQCGKPATRISIGWISPWCDHCAEGLRTRPLDE